MNTTACRTAALLVGTGAAAVMLLSVNAASADTIDDHLITSDGVVQNMDLTTHTVAALPGLTGRIATNVEGDVLAQTSPNTLTETFGDGSAARTWSAPSVQAVAMDRHGNVTWAQPSAGKTQVWQLNSGDDPKDAYTLGPAVDTGTGPVFMAVRDDGQGLFLSSAKSGLLQFGGLNQPWRLISDGHGKGTAGVAILDDSLTFVDNSTGDLMMSSSSNPDAGAVMLGGADAGSQVAYDAHSNLYVTRPATGSHQVYQVLGATMYPVNGASAVFIAAE